MRILVFATETDRPHFNIIMTALTQDPRDHKRAALVKLAALQQSFEDLATREAKPTKKNPEGYELDLRLPSELVLEEEPYDLLKQCMEAIPWRAGGAKQIVATFDFVDAAEHVTAKELAKRAEPKSAGKKRSARK